jgi:diguanylate cyclase (GGDEF)-like protein
MYDWSTHQLTEFFSAITRSGDENGAVALAVERAVEATEAEIGAVVAGGGVLVCLGLGVDHRPDAFTGVTPADLTMTVAGLGDFHISATDLGGGDRELLVVGRLDEPFQPEERQMLKGMSQVLGLAVRGLRTLAAERDLRQEREREAEQRLVLVEALEKREELLETLLQIQRAVCQRAPLQVVLDSVTRGASALLDGALVSLVLHDDGSGRPMVPSISPGHEADRTAPAILAIAAEAMAADHLVVGTPDRILAAPVYVGGDVAGGLVIRLPPNIGSAGGCRDFLAAFAEQASLALTGAHTANEVREAYHDGLTGLPNRGLFLERLERALEHGRREGVTTAVLFIDLDLFKQVNDTLGHAAGDELLVSVASRLQAIVREGDMAARLGGDEFAVLLSPADPDGTALGIAQRITEAIARPFMLGDRETFVRASIGIALSGQAGDSADDLIQNADVAMYRAKKGRPNTPVVFQQSMRTELLRHVELVAAAKQALADGHFSLAYQPILRLSDLAVVGVEALMRSAHPRLGSIAPETFIALAEQNGQIVEVERWALRESCRQLAGWRAAGLPGLTVNVNVSARQFSDDNLARFVGDTLVEFGVPAGSLTLEITESALLHDDKLFARRLAALKSTGVRLAIDGFGTGYSSMSYLSRLPIDQIKIDKSLIDDIGTDPRSFAIARSVIELGRVLELETVAEGIERPDQLAALHGMSCSLGQGFIFAQPLDPGDVRAFAQSRRPSHQAA